MLSEQKPNPNPFIKTVRIILLMLIIIGIALIFTQKFWVPETVEYLLGYQTENLSANEYPGNENDVEIQENNLDTEVETIQTETSVELAQVDALENTGDPAGIVIGYIWDTDPNGPLFKTLQLQLFDEEQSPYGIYILENGKFVLYKELTAEQIMKGDAISLPEGGVSTLKILGVDPKLGICVTDRGRFLTGFTFSKSGEFKGTKIPLTENTPNARCEKDLAISKNRPTGTLVPGPTTIPKGFAEETKLSGESVPYGIVYTKGDAMISISVFINTESGLYSYDSNYAAAKELNKDIKTFTYEDMPGFVSYEENVYGSITYDLYYKDGLNFLRMVVRDDGTMHFSVDSAIEMLKTFERR